MRLKTISKQIIQEVNSNLLTNVFKIPLIRIFSCFNCIVSVQFAKQQYTPEHTSDTITKQVSRNGLFSLRMLMLVVFLVCHSMGSYAQDKIRILNFNGDNGYVHDSKSHAESMIKALAEENQWELISSSDPSIFTKTNLSNFDVVVFSNNCGTEEAIFSEKEQKKFQEFIRSGGGFVGIHCAGAIWHETGEFKDWYEKLIGTRLVAHPPVQSARLHVEQRDSECTWHLPPTWEVVDEWHQFSYNPRKNVNVLISVDESSYIGTQKMNGDHPVSWFQHYDGGRSFFTTLGHTVEMYSNKNYRMHIVAGIKWAAGCSQEYDFTPIKRNLLIDLNADRGVSIEDGDRVEKWTNQIITSQLKEFVKRDAGRYDRGSGRPRLKLQVPEIRNHNTIEFHRQELINHEEDAMDHILTGTGYTWFVILSVNHQVPGLKDVSSFFGNLKNGGNFEGIWGNLTDDNRVWIGSRNGKTFGRWDENNPMVVAENSLETNRYYLICGRMADGTGDVDIELFINDVNKPVASGKYPVHWETNASKLAIGQERDATNHPGRESFDGEISRFLLYDRPLSDGEMEVMANKLLIDYNIKQ